MVKFNKILLLVLLGLNINARACEDIFACAATRDQNQKLRDQLVDSAFKCRLCDKDFGRSVVVRKCLDHYNASALLPSSEVYREVKADHVAVVRELKAARAYKLSFDKYDSYIMGRRLEQSKIVSELPKSTTIIAVDKHDSDMLKRRLDQSKIVSELPKPVVLQELRDKLFTADGHCKLCGERFDAGIIMRSCLTHYGFSALVPGGKKAKTCKEDHVEYIAAIKASGLHAEIFENHERYVLNQRGSSAAHKARKQALRKIVKQAVLGEANKRQRTASPELHE